VIFCGSGSEANSLAIFGALVSRKERNVWVVHEAEHPSVRESARHAQAQGLAKVRWISLLPDGSLDMASLAEALDESVALVSLMAAHNESGVLYPVAEVAAMAHAVGAWVHCDAVQALGKIPVQRDSLGVDLLTFASHKIYGPKGVAALVVSHHTPIHPVQFGGGQEGGLRPGTPAVPLCAAFAEACRQVESDMAGGADEKVRQLRNSLEKGLIELGPRIRILGQNNLRLPNTTLLAVKNAKGRDLVLALDDAGWAISTGSAYHSDEDSPSLMAECLGLSPEWAYGTLRISLGAANTDSEIQGFLRAFQKVLRHG